MSSDEHIIQNGKNEECNKIDVSQKNTDNKANRPKIIFPYIVYRKYPFVSTSIINYLAIGICLLVYGITNLEWFNSNANIDFYIGYYLFSGIILYIIGIINWYEGKELIFLIDLIYSFYFICLFLLENKTLEIFKITKNDNDQLHGTFYLIFSCLIICISISNIRKGKIYLINYAILFFGYLFLFFHKYIDISWAIKVYSIIFIVSGALFGIIGLLKIIDSGLENSSIFILEPTD